MIPLLYVSSTCSTVVRFQALLWMFNDSRSFYFSVDFDLTQSLQRKTAGSAVNIDVQLPFWQKVKISMFIAIIDNVCMALIIYINLCLFVP